MTDKVILITTRWPRTKDERKCFGVTNTNGQVSKIFVNKPRNKRPSDLLDTVFHELTHAIVGQYHTRLSRTREEKLCQAVGRLVVEAFKNA